MRVPRILSIYNYNFITLLIFAIVDVALFSTPYVGISIAFASLIYLFIFASFLKNAQTGLLYLISFNLLTIGWGNYSGAEAIAYNYYGLRVGPFTLNIIFQFAIAFILIARRKGRNFYCCDKYSLFFLAFYFWTLIVGGINCLLGNIYGDNFLNEILRFSPLLCWVVFFKTLTADNLLKAFRYVFAISVIALFCAFLMNKKMTYGTHKYVVYDCLCKICGMRR